MSDWRRANNPYNDAKVIDACSLFGMMDQSGRRFSGGDVITAIVAMNERTNGLGSGFAIYGLYPKYSDSYALHIMLQDKASKDWADSFINMNFDAIVDERMPTKNVPTIKNPPILWRYFVKPGEHLPAGVSEDDYVLQRVMEINTITGKAFVFSSGKDMGVFKGVGYPEDMAEFYCLDEYEGYLWTAHGRFPTNTPGWWGGAHPFSILDWTVIHNGELSSYGINRRYLEMYGYQCTMQTDTEVLAYAVDLLMRRHRFPVDVVAKILAPPFWTQMEGMPPKEKRFYETLRQVYGSLLMNGPFTIIVAHQGEMIGLTDRVKLRPLAAGVKGSMLYLSSESSTIDLVCPDRDRVWNPLGGEPVVGKFGASPKIEVKVQ